MKRPQCRAFLICIGGLLSVAAADEVRLEAESPHLPKPGDALVVEDGAASGGKALKLVGESKRPLSDRIEVPFPGRCPPGVYVLRLRMKVQDAFDIGRAWRADVIADGRTLAYGVAQGYYFKDAKGYRNFDIRFVLDRPDAAVAVRMYWAFDGWYAPCTSKPTVLVDYLELRKIAEAPAIRITKVWPDKVHYLRDEKGRVTIELRNTTGRPVSGRLAVELFHDLYSARLLVRQAVTLKPWEATSMEFPLECAAYYREEALDYGYQVRATVYEGNRIVDRAAEYFCVSDNPHATATTWGPFTGQNDPPDPQKYSWHNRWARKFNESHLSDRDAAEGAMEARKDYVTFWEWGRGGPTSPGGCMDMAPKEDFWICGDSARMIIGKRARQKGVAALAEHGIASVTYNIPVSQGLITLKLLYEHPDWFCVSKDTKDFTMFGYDVAAFEKLAAFLKKYDLSKIPTNNGYMNPPPEPLSNPAFFELNFTKRQVLDYVVDQMIAAMRMFGYVGVRWDCGHLNTGVIFGPWQPYLDFYGKPLCKSPQEMVAQTVANIRYFKQRVRKENPRFCFGTNFGSVEETHRYPEMTRELCRDGGWLLDETAYTYHTPQSAYRFWDKYYAVMSDQGNYVASMGGHYNPFAPTRFGSPYPADRIYHTVFALVGHGHPQLVFRNSCFVIGDPAQFAVRFGRYLFDTRLLRVEQPEKIIEVESSRPLWWNRSVWRKTDKRTDTLVIHLVNPPVSKAIMEDPTSRMPPSALRVSISCRVPPGRTLRGAWALTAESWTSDLASKTQAVALDVKVRDANVVVTLPEIIVWKTVVFQFE